MLCPFCGNADTAVKDSRTTEDQSAIKRRRFCQECGSRFTTFERVQLRDLVVIKKDGNRVPFDRDKLARSITSALHKRPVQMGRVERVINGIVRRLETSGDVETPSHAIGEMAMEALINMDEVAYSRFASVYHDFDSVSDFVTFVTTMIEKAQNKQEQKNPDEVEVA